MSVRTIDDPIRAAVSGERLTEVSTRAGAIHLMLSWGAYAALALAGPVPAT